MELNCIQTAQELLKHDNILIVTHRNPDGDTIGSAGALCSALRRAGKTAYMYPNPQFTEKYLVYITEYIADGSFVPDYIVSTDVSAPDMLARTFTEVFSEKIDLCIDHHPTNPRFGRYNSVHPDMAACSQIILEIVEAMNGGISRAEADLLYIGLSTDCGCFQYSNTDGKAHTAAARLIDCGADVYSINEKFFRLVSFARLKLEGMVYEGMELYHDGTVVFATVTQDMLRETGATEDDLDDISSLPGRIISRKISLTIREKPDGSSKVSVRTAKGYSAIRLCLEFGGGGHEAAAGCTISANPVTAKKQLLETIERLWF